MSRGREARLTAMVLACLTLSAALAGCRSPFPRPAEGTASRPYPEGARSEMPPLQPVPETLPQTLAAPVSAQGMGQESQSGPVAAAPTPLLDAALKHAEAIDQSRRQASPASDPPSTAVATGRSDTPVNGLVAVKTMTAKDDKEPARPPQLPSGPVPAAATPAPPVRAQVVEWLASEAAKPANQAMFQRAANTIADAIKSTAKDPGARSADLRSAVLALEDRVPLGVSELRLCRKVNGFGSFEPLPGSTLRPGQPFLIYCELTGLRYQPRDSSFVSRMSSRVELIATKDGNKVWEQSLGDVVDECRSRRRDNFVNYRISLPNTLPIGEYRLRLTQTDLVANRSASSELGLTLVQ